MSGATLWYEMNEVKQKTPFDDRQATKGSLLLLLIKSDK